MRPGGKWLRNRRGNAARLKVTEVAGANLPEPPNPINFYEMKSTINWRHAVLMALMAVGLYLVGGEVESETAFFTIKPLGLATLWAMYRLHERWWREGKIVGYRARAARNRQS